METICCSDSSFFHEQLKNDRSWVLPLGFAITIHLAVFAATVILPDLLERQPLLLDQMVTVDLVSMPDPKLSDFVPEPPPAPPAPQPQVVQEEVVQPASAPEPAEVSIAPVEEKVVKPVALSQPVSLKPRLRKKRIAKDTRLAEEKEKVLRQRQQQKLARQKKERMKKRAEQARRRKAVAVARKAQQEAEQAAAEARRALAAALRTTQTVAHSKTGPSKRGSKGGQMQSAVVQQYLASLYNRVRSYWILPEMKKWDTGLKTVVVLSIRRDGSVAGMQIEQKSRDRFFDQFVLKTLHSAAPMPRFPAIMAQATLEVGLVFKPGEVAM